MKLYIRNFFALLLFLVIKSIFKIIPQRVSNKTEFLFVNFGQIGDLTISSMLFDIYSKEIENREISFLIDEKFIDLYENYKQNTKIIGLNLQKYQFSFFYRIKTLANFRTTEYKFVYNLTSSRRIMTDEIALLQNSKDFSCFTNNWNSTKNFFRNATNKFYNTIISCDKNNEYSRHLFLFNSIFNVNKEFTIVLNEINKNKTSKLTENNKYIVISPIATQLQKSWNLENFQKLANLLAKDYNVYLLGSNSEVNLINYSFPKNVINLIGETSIMEALEIVKNSKMYIGNDSGFTHIALKNGIPLIGIIGGGTFDMYFPFNENENTKYVFYQTDCYNCEWYCKYPAPICLDNISVEQVFNEAIKVLNS